MIVNINNQEWTCRAAVRKKDKITIYYGTYTEPNPLRGIPPMEHTCNFTGEKTIKEAFVVEGEWEFDAYSDTIPTEYDILDARLTYIEIMTGLTEGC